MQETNNEHYAVTESVIRAICCRLTESVTTLFFSRRGNNLHMA